MSRSVLNIGANWRIGAIDINNLKKNQKMKTVVLMTDYGVGVVVNGGTNNNKVGFYCTSWNMNNFEPYCGKITLEN